MLGSSLATPSITLSRNVWFAPFITAVGGSRFNPVSQGTSFDTSNDLPLQELLLLLFSTSSEDKDCVHGRRAGYSLCQGQEDKGQTKMQNTSRKRSLVTVCSIVYCTKGRSQFEMALPALILRPSFWPRLLASESTGPHPIGCRRAAAGDLPSGKGSTLGVCRRHRRLLPDD